jgi:hypothetical protein
MLLGTGADALLGTHIREAFPDVEGTKARERIERREPIEYEEEPSVPEPESYWETRIAPVVVDGTAVQLVGATRNVTDRRRREKQLEDHVDEDGREHVELIQDSATAAVELTKAASDLSDSVYCRSFRYRPPDVGRSHRYTATINTMKPCWARTTGGGQSRFVPRSTGRSAKFVRRMKTPRSRWTARFPR